MFGMIEWKRQINGGESMQQGSIFEDQANEPLASRLRPENLDQVFGQTHLLGPGKILRDQFS